MSKSQGVTLVRPGYGGYGGYGSEYSGSRTFIVYGSWLGFPAFSLPLLQADGLPFGL